MSCSTRALFPVLFRLLNPACFLRRTPPTCMRHHRLRPLASGRARRWTRNYQAKDGSKICGKRSWSLPRGIGGLDPAQLIGETSYPPTADHERRKPRDIEIQLTCKSYHHTYPPHISSTHILLVMLTLPISGLTRQRPLKRLP